MPECPRCHQPVDFKAIACPTCKLTLKAHGHPGMTLYRAEGGEFLCQTCTYDGDDTCTFPQRPRAKECTLYHNIHTPVAPPPSPRAYQTGWFSRGWLQRNLAWLVLVGLILVSLLLALMSGR